MIRTLSRTISSTLWAAVAVLSILGCLAPKVTSTSSSTADNPAVDYSGLAVQYKGAPAVPVGGYFGWTHYDGGGSSGGAQIAKGKIGCAPSFHDAILFQVSGFATDHDRPVALEIGIASIFSYDDSNNVVANKGFSGTLTTVSLTDTVATVAFDVTDPGGFSLKGQVTLPVCHFDAGGMPIAAPAR